jgi:WD40 repeat protein
MEKNECITGDESGRIIIWNLKTGKSIYMWIAHEGAITQIDYHHDLKLLITSGKDKYIRTWAIPDKWISDDVKKFEENEIKNMSDTLAMLRLQKSLRESEDYNSDEDSLNGWDFKPDLDEY